MLPTLLANAGLSDSAQPTLASAAVLLTDLSSVLGQAAPSLQLLELKCRYSLDAQRVLPPLLQSQLRALTELHLLAEDRIQGRALPRARRRKPLLAAAPNVRTMCVAAMPACLLLLQAHMRSASTPQAWPPCTRRPAAGQPELTAAAECCG